MGEAWPRIHVSYLPTKFCDDDQTMKAEVARTG